MIIEIVGVETYLRTLPHVVDVHDLHICGMSTTEAALTAHLVMPNAACEDSLLNRICRELYDQFGIAHATIQGENGDPAQPCGLAPNYVRTYANAGFSLAVGCFLAR